MKRPGYKESQNRDKIWGGIGEKLGEEDEY